MELSRITEDDFELIKKTVLDQIGRDAWIPMALRPSFDCTKEDGDDDDEEVDDGEDEDEDEDDEGEEDPDPVHRQLIKDFAPKGKKQVDDLFRSKIGGYPYIPRDTAGSTLDGQDFVLQVDLEDISLPELPKKGLLQFFINDNDSARFGGSHIIYYPEPDRTVTLSEVREKYTQGGRSDQTPVEEGKCQFMKFKKERIVNWASTEIVGPVMMKAVQDFYKLAPKKVDEESGQTDYGCAFDYDELNEALLLDSCVPSNIGGWYGWVQADPWEDQNRFTLFFLDSNTTCYNPRFDNYMFGDSGTGAWTMDLNDVLNHDFDKHDFSWDCC